MIPAPIGTLAWLQERLTKTEVMITMRDGAKLFTSYYLPKDLSKSYPILLIRTPYNAEPSAEGFSYYVLKDLCHLVEAGYIFAIQDVRGRQQSEGVFQDVRPHIPRKENRQRRR